MINNDFYEELGNGWLTRFDHPVALLRAENAARAPWIAGEIRQRVGAGAKVLDVGCGAGFLANRLGVEGHQVTGVDLSASSLQVAAFSDTTRSVKYIQANAYNLPCENASFDVVCATDVLEHVDEPARLINEVSRVLRPGGTFFFHTFNRNAFSRLLIIKGVEWCVRNAPKNMHVYSLFIKPRELAKHLQSHNLEPIIWRGLVPKLCSYALLQLLFTRRVPSDFSFRFCKSLKTGYCGIAVKQLP